MPYTPDSSRYESMEYRRCGRTGLKLPIISLGLWHNFGDVDDQEAARDMILRSFDLGITHFDLANNYGPPPGSAETNFGRIFGADLKAHRHEMVISSKAGYRMWPGPYGDGGSRKYLLDSLDESLQRMKLDHVDVFYHHRPDLETDLEESMSALELAVRQGKAIYAGISSYGLDRSRLAARILRERGVNLTIHQPNYSMLRRNVETEVLPVAGDEGFGVIAFCPLAQGLLTDKYLKEIPDDSRAAKPHGFLKKDRLTPEMLKKIEALNEIALQRGQTLARMALQWSLRDARVTSALIGASRVAQIEENVKILEDAPLTTEELEKIDGILE